MARKVFFSFKYEDVSRAMIVRNSDVIKSDEKVGFIDAADFEAVEKRGDAAIRSWIDVQLSGTSVTVVCVGANTDKSKWVKYEIDQSVARGNAIIAVNISKIKGLPNATTTWCGTAFLPNGTLSYKWFDDDGYNNLGKWIDAAAKAKGK